MKVKVSELSGAALDFAVAKATDHDLRQMFGCNSYNELFKPSSDWAQCGPLIDRYSVHVNPPFCGSVASAYVETGTFGGAKGCTGKTTLEAICRSLVLSLIGDEVDVPVELEVISGN